ncbi:MAG: hypothetical protein AAGK74_03450, partial [Chloroflexota bacterium]
GAIPDYLYAPVIDDEAFGYQQVNVAAQMNDPESLLNTVRHMVHVRKTLGMLPKGSMEWMEHHSKASLSFWRQSEAGTLAALHNLSDEELVVDMPEGHYIGALDTTDRSEGGHVLLPPYGYRWYIVGS